MGDGRLVARDDEPGVAVGERPVQRERLLSGDPEDSVDAAVEHGVDDRLGDGRRGGVVARLAPRLVARPPP
ncbi:hypothetical protein [Halorubrum sp. AD140]|uniref:hypothetical protein n=1 Tax=Halorubrum sp. AD140 TaxID=3050073 RepID=UPI0031F2D6A8